MSALDADTVMAEATERMLAQGKHAPLLVIATPTDTYYLPIGHWAEDASDRAKTLFLMGRSFGQERGVRAEAVSAIFLAAEVWTIKGAAADELPTPSEHPDRRECLSLLELRPRGKTLKQTMYLAEILRHGETIDLGPRQTLNSLQTNLLPSFFAGLGSAPWSDRQLLERLKGLNL